MFARNNRFKSPSRVRCESALGRKLVRLKEKLDLFYFSLVEQVDQSYIYTCDKYK